MQRVRYKKVSLLERLPHSSFLLLIISLRSFSRTISLLLFHVLPALNVWLKCFIAYCLFAVDGLSAIFVLSTEMMETGSFKN